MPDLRRISGLAIFFIVILRMAIGWQFLYEGLWKLDTQGTPNAWSAEGYLKNARGPFRDFFRNLTGDPNDLNWLDYDRLAARWDRWQREFENHYLLSPAEVEQHREEIKRLQSKGTLSDKEQQRLQQLSERLRLDGNQRRWLDELLNGPREFRAELEKLPEGVQFGGSLAKAVRFDPQQKRLIVDGKRHLTPRERDILLQLPRLDENATEEQKRLVAQYQEAVRTVFNRASRLSIKERARALLKGDPERATQIYKEHEGTSDYKRVGQIDLYRNLLGRYEQALAQADQAFEYEHLEKLGYPGYGTLPQLRAELVGPIKALEEELKHKAQQFLTAEQRARGPVSMPASRMDRINQITMWSLVVLGALLIGGFVSRLAAVGAAAMLVSFYLAMPPEPLSYGFQELPGPEHSYLVDKNLIEVFALLAIAAMPTGRWFGVDAVFGALAARRRMKKQRTKGAEAGTRAGPQQAASPESVEEATQAEPAQQASGYSLKQTK